MNYFINLKNYSQSERLELAKTALLDDYIIEHVRDDYDYVLMYRNGEWSLIRPSIKDEFYTDLKEINIVEFREIMLVNPQSLDLTKEEHEILVHTLRSAYHSCYDSDVNGYVSIIKKLQLLELTDEINLTL